MPDAKGGSTLVLLCFGADEEPPGRRVRPGCGLSAATVALGLCQRHTRSRPPRILRSARQGAWGYLNTLHRCTLGFVLVPDRWTATARREH